MSGPSRTLTLAYVANTSRFNKGTKEAEGTLGKFGKSFAKFGKVAAAGALAAGASLVVLGKKLFDAAEEAGTANARIEAIAGSMDLFGDETRAVTDRIVDLANSQAALTGVSRTTIKETAGLLLTFRSVASTADEVGGVFDRANAAALDLAAAGFGSATGNAQQLGKALEDPIKGLTALTRSGVTFTEAERDRIKALVESNQVGEAQALILEAIEKQVGGTAEATANASEQIRERFGVLKDTIALQLAPTFAVLTDFVLRLVERLVELWNVHGPRVIEFVNNAVARFREFAAILRERFEPPLRDAISRVRDFITAIREWWQQVSPGVIDSFKRLKEPIMLLWENIKIAFEQTKNIIGAFRTGESDGKGFQRFIDFLVDSITLLLGVLNRAIELLNKLRDVILRIVESAGFQTLLRGVSAVASGIGGIVGRIAGRGGDTGVPNIPGASSGTTNINVNAGIGDPAAIAREVQRTIRDENARAGTPSPILAGAF
jgi:hypothetical protein